MKKPGLGHVFLVTCFSAVGVTMALAATELTMYPATLQVSWVSYALPERVRSFEVGLWPEGGGVNTRKVGLTRNDWRGMPVFDPVDIALDGGEPGPENAGRRYSMSVDLDMPAQGDGDFRIWLAEQVMMRNRAAVWPWIQPEPDRREITIEIPSLERVHAKVSVQGNGEIREFHLHAQAVAPNGNLYSATTRVRSGNGAPLLETWIPMVGQMPVTIWGSAIVEDEYGTLSHRPLSSRMIASTSELVEPWVVELWDVVRVHAMVLEPWRLPEAHSRSCSYSGVDNASLIHGEKVLAAGETGCAVVVPRLGNYWFHLRSSLVVPANQSTTSAGYFVDISGDPPGSDRSFYIDDEYGTGSVAVQILGLPQAAFSSVKTRLVRNNDSHAFSSRLHSQVGVIDHLLPAGTWRVGEVSAQLSYGAGSGGNVQETMNIEIYNDPQLPFVSVSAFGVTPLGQLHLPLVQATLTFHVFDWFGASPGPACPTVRLHRIEHNGALLARTYEILAQSYCPANQPSSVSVAAPPGEYTMYATATVNGTEMSVTGNATISAGAMRVTALARGE
jgi:hypothetical protein